MTDHPERGQAVPSLMRQPERCDECGYVHMPDESCRAPVTCSCGAPAGIYAIDPANPDRECWRCIRDRIQ